MNIESLYSRLSVLLVTPFNFRLAETVILALNYIIYTLNAFTLFYALSFESIVFGSSLPMQFLSSNC